MNFRITTPLKQFAQPELCAWQVPDCALPKGAEASKAEASGVQGGTETALGKEFGRLRDSKHRKKEPPH